MARRAEVDKHFVASVADQLGRDKNTLGLDLRMTEGEIEPRIPVKPISRATARQMDAIGVVNLADVAAAHAARHAGQSFAGEYGRVGLMLASAEHSPTRYIQQMAAVASASSEELQAVARRTSKSYVDKMAKEANLRLDQALINHPADLNPRLFDTSGGKTVEGNRAKLVDWFRNLDFDQQKSMSMKDGMVISLGPDDTRLVQSLRRGYNAIAEELSGRGIDVEVMLNGRDGAARRAASRDFVEAANAGPTMAPRSRRARDGVEI